MKPPYLRRGILFIEIVFTPRDRGVNLKEKKQTRSISARGKTFAVLVAGVVILFITSGIVLAQETESNDTGEFHCYVGAVGMVLVALSLAGGFLSSGRFGRIKGWKPGRFHYQVTIITAFYLLGEFMLGFTKITEPFPISLHSMIGVSTPVLAWMIVFLSPCLAGKKIPRQVSSRIHAVLSILLLLMVIVQVLYANLILGG